MRLHIDATGLGVDEEIGIELPDGFDSFTTDLRRAWAAAEIDAIALEMLADLGSMRDAVPTPEQAAAFLRGIQPGIGRALGGIDG